MNVFITVIFSLCTISLRVTFAPRGRPKALSGPRDFLCEKIIQSQPFHWWKVNAGKMIHHISVCCNTRLAPPLQQMSFGWSWAWKWAASSASRSSSRPSRPSSAPSRTVGWTETTTPLPRPRRASAPIAATFPTRRSKIRTDFHNTTLWI